MQIPKITIQGWTEHGPAYTIHRSIGGFRNRKARRRGYSANETVGPHDALDDAPFGDGPAVFMLWALGDDEVWGYKAGHVYLATLLVDGEPLDILIDAREDDSIQHWGEDLSLLEGRVLEGEELDRALAGELPHEPASDDAESQEPIMTLTGAQTELEDAPADGTPTEEATVDDGEEQSTGDADFDGTVNDFVDLAEAVDDEDLAHYAISDSRKGIREAARHEIERRESSAASDAAAAGGDGPAPVETE